MAKFHKRIKAQELRRKGESIKETARKLDVAKSTVSIWCRDIKLTKEQILKLNKKIQTRGYIGRLKGATLQRQRRLEKIEKFKKEGLKKFKKLSKREFITAGLGLYWGEGNTEGNRVGFSNSNPEMIKFMMSWFREICNIDDKRFTLCVGINEIHKDRVKEVEKYWTKITGIPQRQFTKTVLQKARTKKIYKNRATHFGTLSIRINRSSDLQYQILGLINGLIHGRE